MASDKRRFGRRLHWVATEVLDANPSYPPFIDVRILIMKKLLLLLAGIASLGASGCAACCSPYDFDYPTFGGKWERLDRQHGRVGSAFYDPSQVVTGEEVTITEGDGSMIEGAVYLDAEVSTEN
jgi:hypothetical protein